MNINTHGYKYMNMSDFIGKGVTIHNIKAGCREAVSVVRSPYECRRKYC